MGRSAAGYFPVAATLLAILTLSNPAPAQGASSSGLAVQTGLAATDVERGLEPVKIPTGLSLARIFGDHMVLQRDRPVNIWGWAEAGEKITVAFAGQTHTATAGADRRWMVRLQPLAASFEGRELTVTGATKTLRCKDVLVGEVWLCGGQSNMSFPLWVRPDGFDPAEADKYPFLRAISTLHGEFADPPYDVKKTAAGDSWLVWALREPQPTLPFQREWMVFGKEALQLHGPPFSAFGFHFARKLYERLHVPVGIVDTSVGGTLAHYWASVEELRKLPEMAPVFAKPSPPWYPGCLYHTTILPIRDLALRGALFYLGENNSQSMELAALFEGPYRAAIKTWRDTFGDPKMPFCIIQTANCGSRQEIHGPGPTQLVQESQLRIHLSTPHTGFVVTADDLHSDLHVIRKQSIAERAVRWAMAEVYVDALPGNTNRPTWRGAVFKSADKKNERLVLHFVTMNNEPLKLTGTPAGFVVAGEDRKFHEARAELAGPSSVAVWSEQVPAPVAARFGWAGRPFLNLATESGLPASPFRTDDWPVK
jgi:sialate O-acetylesterase